jgi:hypothetical protein
VTQRAQGFRWLREDEIEVLRAQHEATSKKPTAAERKAPFPKAEGTEVKPAAAFFKARVQESVLECHPDKVQILTPIARED